MENLDEITHGEKIQLINYLAPKWAIHHWDWINERSCRLIIRILDTWEEAWMEVDPTIQQYHIGDNPFLINVFKLTV